MKKYKSKLVVKAICYSCRRLQEMDRLYETDYKFCNLGNILQLTDLVLNKVKVKVEENPFDSFPAISEKLQSSPKEQEQTLELINESSKFEDDFLVEVQKNRYIPLRFLKYGC